MPGQEEGNRLKVGARISYTGVISRRMLVTGGRQTKFVLTIEHLWLGVPVFVLLWKTFLFPIPVLDFWWHLELGKVIAETKSIPATDLFSFTATGKLFIAQNWLGELIYYGLYRLGGLPLIVFGNAMMALGGFLAVYSLCLKATKSLRMAAAVSTLAALGVIGTIRPQIFSFLMFALYYWVLVCYRSHGRNHLWLLPPLMMLWVNLHGAFVLGLGLIALFIVCEGLRRLIDDRRTDVLSRPQLRRLITIFVLSALATLVNPEGYKVYDYVRTVVADEASQKLVAEWQPPQINDTAGIVLFYAPFFLTLLVFIYARVKPDLTDLALFIGFGMFGLTALRNGAWFSIIAYPLLARYVSHVDFSTLLSLRRFKVIDRGMSPFDAGRSNEQTVYPRINFLFASLAVFGLLVQTPWVRPTLYQTSLMQPGTPVGAMDYIEQHNLNGNIFHPQIFGDYLIWRLWPEQRSFFDGRVHIFGLDFVEKYLSIYHDSRWESILQKWNVHYVLLSKLPTEKGSLDMIATVKQSPRWEKLYEDDVSILFTKKSSGS
jgi:hypothetical protein